MTFNMSYAGIFGSCPGRQHVKAMGKKKESKAERILRQVACGACTPPLS